MSEGDTGGSPMALPVELLIRRGRASGDKPPWLGIVVAALLHVLVLLWLYIDWSHPPSLPQEPEVIPVQVVFVPPPPPPVVVAPPKPLPPQRFPPTARESRAPSPEPASPRRSCRDL